MKPQHTHQPFTLDDIIPKLRKARVSNRNGERSVVACCPAHDDENPSLHITETRDGKLLWKCHAGCSQEAVQRELERLAGVNRATTPQKPQQNQSSATTQPLTLSEFARAKRLNSVKLHEWGVREQSDGKLAIHYLTRDGEVSAVQYRLALTGEKRFKWRSGDKPIIYGLWRISEWDPNDTLYLCEACTDTWSMWSAGLQACGIPSASTWYAEWWDEVKDFHRIVLIPDTDKAGAELVKKLANTVPMELASRVYVLRLPNGIKDTNELWVRENAEPERFKQALAGCTVESLMDVSRGETEPRRFKLVLAETREPEVAHTIVPNLLYAERITILAGEAGVGKTTFALEIADALTRTGKLWNETVEVQPARILWLDYDHDWGRLQEILNTYYGVAHREIYAPEIPEPKTQQPESKQPPRLSWETLADYRSAIEECGIDLIVADTAFEWLDIQDGNDETEARVKLQLVRELIAGTGCGVLLLHHPRKTVGDGGRTTALAGSHRFAAKVDVVAFLIPIERDGMDVVKFIVAKDRDGERREMELQRVSRKFIPLQRNAVPTGEWGIVKAYLQQHGEATYKELTDALIQAKKYATEESVRKRVKRWEKRGLVIVEIRKDKPPKAIVKLPIVRIHGHGHGQPDTHSVRVSEFPSLEARETDTPEQSDTLSYNNVRVSDMDTIEEVVEHTDSLSCNDVRVIRDSDIDDTPTSLLTHGSKLGNSDISDISDTTDNTVRDWDSRSGSGDEPLQQFTIENNPPSTAGYEAPEPTAVSDGGVSSLTVSDNHPAQHNPATGELSDSTNQTTGGIEMMNRTNRNNTVDTDTLFRTALQVGFPRFTVQQSNGKRLDVDGSYAGWCKALPTLAQENVMREAYLALHRCKPRKETQPIAVKIEQPDTFSFSTVWRVEVVSVEWMDDGKRLKWVFRTLDDNRTLTATTKYSTEPDSKFARWVRLITREANPPIDTISLSQLVGKVADGLVIHKHNRDGEQLELFNLIRVKRYEPQLPSGTEPTEPQPTEQQTVEQLLLHDSEQQPTEPLAEPEPPSGTEPQLLPPEVFQHRNPLVWDLMDEWLVENLRKDEREQIRLMLAYAEACDYPELPVPDIEYTIHGSMGGWLTAAKHFAGSPTILLLTKLLHTRATAQNQQPQTESE